MKPVPVELLKLRQAAWADRSLVDQLASAEREWTESYRDVLA